VIALWLDATIREESHGKHSLNDVMFRMVRDRQQAMTEERIFKTVADYVSDRSLALLKQAADQQGNLPAPAAIPGLDRCYRAAQGDYPTFDLGFDYRKTRTTKDKTIVGVELDGPAYKAGLRDGEQWVSSSYDRDDPHQLATVTISGDGTGKQISFLPLGHAVTAWQYLPSSEQTCPAKSR
jgi:predicted metalloprotease with PDZ domain